MAEFSSLNGYQVKDTVARSIAKGRNQAVAFVDYETMIETLNGMEKDEYRAGQNIYIGVVGVPDLWVYGIEDIVHNFEYVSDEEIVEMLKNNTTIQVGYYKLAMLEGQKVDLTTYDQHLLKHDDDIAEINDDIAEINESLEWKLLGTASSTNAITIPNCNEVSIIGYQITSTEYKNPLFTVPRTVLTDGYYTVGGTGNSQASNSIVRLTVTNNAIKVYKVVNVGSSVTDKTADYRVDIYYR